MIYKDPCKSCLHEFKCLLIFASRSKHVCWLHLGFDLPASHFPRRGQNIRARYVLNNI